MKILLLFFLKSFFFFSSRMMSLKIYFEVFLCFSYTECTFKGLTWLNFSLVFRKLTRSSRALDSVLKF